MAAPEHRDDGKSGDDGGKKPGSSELPVWFRVAAIGTLVVTLVAHVMVDIFVEPYEGSGTSLMLGGIVGTALGLNEFFRRGGG